MTRFLRYVFVIIAAGALTGVGAWFLTSGQSPGGTSALSSGENSVAYDGPVAISNAQFPLGMGCSALDIKKTDILVRRELSARGMTQLNGPAFGSVL